MDFKKARCPECARQFCCVAHRVDHQAKNHSELFRDGQDLLLNLFQRKAEKILLKTQQRHHQTTAKAFPSTKEKISKKAEPPKIRMAVKRRHSEINKRILSTTVTLTSQSRQILVPFHRITLDNNSKHVREDILKEFLNTRKDSPCEDGIAKTSTPITKHLLLPKTPSETWSVSPASTISNYQTPNEACTVSKLQEQGLELMSRRGATITPMRGIIAKISRYEGDSPSISQTRSRKVTFSFGSSQVSSSNSSPLESVQEVEVHEEIKDERQYVEIASGIGLIESCAEAKELTVTIAKQIQEVVQDSSSSVKETGFFSCVTKIFCTAVPSFVSWRNNHNDNNNRSKRSRSPDSKEAELAIIQSPVHKRPCYPCDLRTNPIRARKPISSS